MTEEPKRRGRPSKSHLHEDHHFRTSDNAEAAGAPPASADAGEESVSETGSLESQASALSEHNEAVVENPTIALDVGNQEVFQTKSSEEWRESQIYGQQNAQNADTLGSLSRNQESPIEEKIHNLMDEAALNGWHPIETEIVLKMPPRNGMPVRLSDNVNGDGILAMWKRTRKFANSTHRWVESGKWVDFQSGMDVPIKPKYWRERF